MQPLIQQIEKRASLKLELGFRLFFRVWTNWSRVDLEVLILSAENWLERVLEGAQMYAFPLPWRHSAVRVFATTPIDGLRPGLVTRANRNGAHNGSSSTKVQSS